MNANEIQLDFYFYHIFSSTYFFLLLLSFILLLFPHLFISLLFLVIFNSTPSSFSLSSSFPFLQLFSFLLLLFSSCSSFCSLFPWLLNTISNSKKKLFWCYLSIKSEINILIFFCFNFSHYLLVPIGIQTNEVAIVSPEIVPNVSNFLVYLLKLMISKAADNLEHLREKIMALGKRNPDLDF